MRDVGPELESLVRHIKAGDLKAASEYLPCIEELWMLNAALRQHDINVLGYGCYSTVCQVPGESTVIKINYKSWDSWVHYAQYAMANHPTNPMLPLIHELHIEDNRAIARMEKLEPSQIDTSVGMGKVVRTLSADLRRYDLSKVGVKQKALRYMKTMFDMDYIGGYSRINLAKIVVWMAKLRNEHFGIEADCHGKNWMARGNELVLTDPIA